MHLGVKVHGEKAVRKWPLAKKATLRGRTRAHSVVQVSSASVRLISLVLVLMDVALEPDEAAALRCGSLLSSPPLCMAEVPALGVE